MRYPTYSVLLPAYNAQEFIGKLLDEINILKIKPESILVVNDGSKDETAIIARQKNACVVSLGKNNGKGIALKKGFEIFLNEKRADYVLCMDSDLQHSPASILDFVTKAAETSYPVIIGRRNISLKNMPFFRYLSNMITSKTISLITNREISDSQCGMRLINLEVLKRIDLHECGFQLETEFIFKCVEQNVSIEFVDIPTIYNNSHSSIRHFNDTFKFLRLIAREIFKKWFMRKNARK